MLPALILALFIVGVILAAIDEATSQGKNLTDWAIIAIGIGGIILVIK